ncbi:MAG: acetate--CoA ligase family protein [Betaproteobacteria bacterium]|nr:acetate--CoA ligase family protein [Betaproteobacteria bacterium]MBI2291831.1 acetate--CoA ligase family protein [Betaproteobacteria bacterium]
MPNVLDRILNPRTVAVVGASNDPEKRGYRAIKTLLADEYQGEIIPINPREKKILDLDCYARLQDAPQEIDLALICTPARTVPDVVRQCGEKGVKGALLLAGGFSEASEEGRKLEEETAAIARQYGVRLIGPNTNGMFSARYACNAIGWFDIPRGPIAVLSNSANVALSLVTEAQIHRYIGYSTMLSVGNQADLQFHDYLECLGEDPDTRAIISYVEGFKDGRAYLKAARKVTPVKPIVMYKAGRTDEGKGAAKSHSGSLAGDYTVASGVLRQAGVVLVTQSDHLYPVAEALAILPPLPTRRVAILSEGGGPITIAAEALAERGMVLAQLTQDTQQKLKGIVPNASALSNPVDAGGGTDPRAEYYGLCGRAILEDPNVDALLMVGYFGGYTTRYGESVAETENRYCVEVADMMKQYGKPIVVQTHYADFRTKALDILRKAGVPFYREIEIAVQCLASLADYTAAKRRLSAAEAGPRAKTEPAAAQIVQRVHEAARTSLLETEARELLACYGVAIPPALLARTAEDAEDVVAKLGAGPLALKIVSKDVLHKSEAGGVKLNVAGAEAVKHAIGDITASVKRHDPAADVAGVLAAPMAEKGVEVIVGVTRDPQFGPVLMFGLGGVFVEVIRDVVFRALPLSQADVEEMLRELRYKAMLEGARGLPAVDKSALVDLMLKVAALAAAHPEIVEIDLNPVIAHASGYTIADARMILAGA